MNAYFVENATMEKLEEEVGMLRGGAEEKLVRAEDELEEAMNRAVRTKERREKAEKQFKNAAEAVETLQTEVDCSAHLPETPSPRKSDPFAPARVASILSKVTIGPDLSESERMAARNLITEYADIFALDLTEVLLVKTHAHRLDIPPGTTFRKRVAPKPLSQAQKEWLYPTIEAMGAANIIKRVPNVIPAAVSPTN
ncbi:hypothetical protein FRC10_001019, partial [Ceratobasidium sp. 414]